MFLNVCGLKSKLLYHDYYDLINKHDICLFVETKTDDLDVLNVPNGYLYYCKHRSVFEKKSGGLTILYKENFKPYLKFPKTNSELVQWVLISNEILQDDKDLLLGCVYIPPENSKYASKEGFSEIEDEILQLQSNKCKIALLGGFIAKTKTLDDYVVPDDSLFEVLDDCDDSDLLVYLYDYQKLLLNNISLQRFSQDSSPVNNYGYKLLDFCKKMNIYIGNSRLNGNDKTVGKKKLVKMYRLLIIFFCLLMFFQPSNILIFWTIIHYFLMSIADLVCICIQMSTKILLLKISVKVVIPFILNGMLPNKGSL